MSFFLKLTADRAVKLYGSDVSWLREEMQPLSANARGATSHPISPRSPSRKSLNPSPTEDYSNL
ncbi:MAG: hypothetical protein SW833_27505 [Cyanobacteriota bacterium]|nr:hypothetical protein [Cyanobacteriota bacterium]